MSNSNLQYIGLDFETSGVDHGRNAPIEIGIATEWGNVFDSTIGRWKWTDEKHPMEVDPLTRRYEWSDEAEGIHGIGRSELATAPNALAVDQEALRWIRTMVGTDAKQIIAVGWNIAAFDFPFLREYLPATSKAMSYRSVDLNAVLFTIIEAELKDASGDPWTYYGLKSFVKSMAADAIADQTGIDETAWHRAGYDALASIYAFFEMQEVIRRSSL